MHLSKYQVEARKTAVYPDKYRTIYPAMALAEEAGEVAGKVAKALRKGTLAQLDVEAVVKEMGDVLWQLANLASDLGTTLDAVAMINLEKLADRAARGVLKGEGDNR